MQPSPPLGLAVLAGHLRRQGVTVEQVDLEALIWRGRKRPGLAARSMGRVGRAGPTSTRTFEDLARVEAHISGASRDRRISATVRAWTRLLPRPLSSFTHLGLSVMSLGQLAPSLCLAHELKATRGLTVVLGGSYITDRQAPILSRYPFIDHLVLGEGEGPLRRMLSGEDPGAIPNLISRQGDAITRGPAGEAYEEDLAPDFRGLPLSLYGQRDPRVLPIEMSKGCRNRCAFCITSRKPTRLKPPEEVVAEMARGRQQHGARCFLAVDNAINMDRQHSLEVCRALEAARLEVFWSAYFIPEDPGAEYFQLLHRAGCVQLRWGVESLAPATLASMDKEVDARAVSSALASAAACGIWNHLLLMVAHPGETPADLLRTAALLVQNRHHIRSALVSPLDLGRVDLGPEAGAAYQGSSAPAMVSRPHAFGVQRRELAVVSARMRRRLLELTLTGCGVKYRRNFSRYVHDVQRDQFIFRAFHESLERTADLG